MKNYLASLALLTLTCNTLSTGLCQESAGLCQESPSATHEQLAFQLRTQQPVAPQSSQFHRLTNDQRWPAHQTAVIVCDMWDAHHCLNAVRRVNELAPRIDRFVSQLRSQGVTVIHAPSSCMAAYQDHPARHRSLSTPASKSFPPQIGDWCHSIPSEEAAVYPLDQSDGGEDDDPVEHRLWAASLEARGLNPRAPWTRQCDAIHIDRQHDFISDSGEEIWSILQHHDLQHVILVGVHTNMCVLGRPFGLRRLATAGKQVVLARDLTDTMYNPNSWPYVNHFTGTDRIIAHIERYVCPTISSGQVLGDDFRFANDRRPRLVMMIGDDEYHTDETLPKFADEYLGKHFSVSSVYAVAKNPNDFISLTDISRADVLLVSVRRRPLPEPAMGLLREFVRSGKPVVGIRTASHAFSLRNQSPTAGLVAWPEFDAQVFGGNYSNHYGNDQLTQLSIASDAQEHPILLALADQTITPAGSLYKTGPLAAGTQVLMSGSIPEQPSEPVSWTFIRQDGGRSFYTSLGHPEDFAQESFCELLAAGIRWASLK